MKKILFTSLAVLGLGITGCSNEDLGVAKSGVDEVCATMGCLLYTSDAADD